MALGTLQSLTQIAKSVSRPNAREVLTVPVTDVVSKEQVRKKFKNIPELAETMKTEGQQTPIIVFPKNSVGKYVIQKGERRWRAISFAGLKTIDIIVNSKEQSHLDEVAGELIENIQRENLTAMEIANALGEFVEAGWQQKDLAERIGKSRAFVSTHLSLLKLPEGVTYLFDEDIVTDADTLSMLRKVYELDPARCNVVCNMAKKQGITRKHASELLDAVKAKVAEQKEAEKRAKEGAKAADKAAPAEPVSNAEVERAEQARRQAQSHAAAEPAKQAAPVSTKKASAKSKAEPVNPFLEPEERNAKAGAATVDAQVPKALAGKVHPIDPQDLVIRVRVNDKAPWEGELALNLVGESNHALLVKNTDTEQLVSVDVKKLQIVGVLA